MDFTNLITDHVIRELFPVDNNNKSLYFRILYDNTFPIPSMSLNYYRFLFLFHYFV